MQSSRLAGSLLLAVVMGACGPHAHIPIRPASVPGAFARDAQEARLARALAPVLYLQRDESFHLSRVVAIVDSARRMVAYHLLWRDDVHGAWLPFTKPTDEEIVWVGYDSTGAPTEIWTYWHLLTLHTDWRGKGPVAIDVQWGKHGSLPRGTIRDDLPWPHSLGMFWLASYVGLPDIWLGKISREGPWCFCHGFGRYRQFTTPLPVAQRIDAVVGAADARLALRAVFGESYSMKRLWP